MNRTELTAAGTDLMQLQPLAMDLADGHEGDWDGGPDQLRAGHLVAAANNLQGVQGISKTIVKSGGVGPI